MNILFLLFWLLNGFNFNSIIPQESEQNVFEMKYFVNSSWENPIYTRKILLSDDAEHELITTDSSIDVEKTFSWSFGIGFTEDFSKNTQTYTNFPNVVSIFYKKFSEKYFGYDFNFSWTTSTLTDSFRPENKIQGHYEIGTFSKTQKTLSEYNSIAMDVENIAKLQGNFQKKIIFSTIFSDKNIAPKINLREKNWVKNINPECSSSEKTKTCSIEIDGNDFKNTEKIIWKLR